MDLAAAFGVSFFLLILSIYKGVFLGYAMMAAVIIFGILAVKRGYKNKEVLSMAGRGGKKALIVIQIFILIGAVMSIWMASGTVPSLIYYGVKFLNPKTFILSAFIISAVTSLLMGTSAGTSGTVGIALILIAKTGGVNIPAVAGAIIAGAYFGDRCSPMSSSANLVAFVTGTDIYENVRNMLKSSIVPLIISAVFYFLLSFLYPLRANSSFITGEILKSYNISILMLLPVLIIIVFSVFRIDVKISMVCSIITAAILGIVYQHVSIINCIHYIFYGYHMDNSPLSTIIKGGGMLNMVNTCIVLFIASTLAGIIDESKIMNSIEKITEKAESRFEIFRNVTVTSIFAAAIGCCQAFTIMLSDVLNQKSYKNNNIDNYSRALDLENTSVLISALIPWNLSLLLPMTILGVDYSCMPFLFYIYILPIWNFLYLYGKQKYLCTKEVLNANI